MVRNEEDYDPKTLEETKERSERVYYDNDDDSDGDGDSAKLACISK